jgi:nucleoid-associated protein YejK
MLMILWFLGLGGTSLINANVFMEADKETLAMKAWPPEIRDNVDELDRCKSRRRTRDE